MRRRWTGLDGPPPPPPTTWLGTAKSRECMAFMLMLLDLTVHTCSTKARTRHNKLGADNHVGTRPTANSTFDALDAQNRPSANWTDLPAVGGLRVRGAIKPLPIGNRQRARTLGWDFLAAQAKSHRA